MTLHGTILEEVSWPLEGMDTMGHHNTLKRSPMAIRIHGTLLEEVLESMGLHGILLE